MEEIWKDIKGYEGLYQVSNTGKVRSLDRKVWNYTKKGRILKMHNNGHGYYNVSLHNKEKTEKHAYIHILVAKAFIPNPNNYEQVNHKDFDKSNNSANNLEWVSRKQNVLHYRESSYSKKIEKKRQKKFSSKTLKRVYDNKNEIISLYNEGYSVVEVAKKLNVGRDFVTDVLKIFDKI